MKMKAYIKPELLIVDLKMQALLNSNSVTEVTGADGLDTDEEEFTGTADSRRRRHNQWEDEEEEEEQW
jgi:hypothetical protein